MVSKFNLIWKCLFTRRRPVVNSGDSFWGRVTLRLALDPVASSAGEAAPGISQGTSLVVTNLVCVSFSNLLQFAPREKKLLQEATSIRRGRVYSVAKNYVIILYYIIFICRHRYNTKTAYGRIKYNKKQNCVNWTERLKEHLQLPKTKILSDITWLNWE